MNLQEFRATTGLSLTEFAERTGLNRSAISAAELGKATIGIKMAMAVQSNFHCIVRVADNRVHFLDEKEWLASQPNIEEMFRNADVQSPDA